MPAAKREAALERVNRMRAGLGVPEKNLDGSLRAKRGKEGGEGGFGVAVEYLC